MLRTEAAHARVAAARGSARSAVGSQVLTHARASLAGVRIRALIVVVAWLAIFFGRVAAISVRGIASAGLVALIGRRARDRISCKALS